MTRQRPSLRLPLLREKLPGFPRFVLGPAGVLWRAVHDGHGPWWFSSSLQGRFDLPPPHGTCYLASDDLGALLEVLGPQLLPGGCAPSTLLQGLHLRELRVPTRRRLANALSDRASRWVTAELSTLTPYDIPQAWARAFHAAGFQGLRYAVRHSASRRRWSAALFDLAGERERWPRGRKLAIGGEIRKRLAARCGILLFDVPTADELFFAPD